MAAISFAFSVAVPAIPVPDQPHHFTIGLLGVLVVMMVAVLVYVLRTLAAAQAAQMSAHEANQAVNNTGPGEHRLYDRVHNIEEEFGRFRDSNAAEHESIIRLISINNEGDPQ